MIRVAIQKATQAHNLPSPQQLRKWAKTAIAPHRKDAELTLRIVDNAEMTALNDQYRHKNKPTNVLSFPFECPPGVQLPLLGDIIICAPVVAAEALSEGKSLEAHWAHMVIHGSLHLLGFDHIKEDEAQAMESLETTLMQQLHYPDPYGE